VSSISELPVGSMIAAHTKEYEELLKRNGFIEPKGQTLSIKDYPDLYNAIGENYGDTFNDNSFKLPSLKGYYIKTRRNK